MRSYSEHIARVSTALADTTRREIMELVVGSESPLSVREVAEHFGLHGNAARMHLDKLVQGGLLRVMRRRGGRGGRPAKLYGASGDELEISLPPRQYKLLAQVLIRGLAGEEAAGLERRLGREAYARGREEAMAASSPLARLAADADITEASRAWGEDIRRRGHRCRVEALPGGAVAMTFLTCPFGEFSRSHPSLVCELHRRLEEGFLSLAGPLRLTATERQCVFTIEAEAGAANGG